MSAIDLKTFDTEVAAALVAAYGANTRALSDYISETTAIARGGRRWQLRIAGAGYHYTSNITREIAQVQLAIAYRLGLAEAEGTFTRGALLDNIETWSADTLWRAFSSVYDLAADGSFVTTDITVVGEVIVFTIEGTVICVSA